ncbi:RagB/SusD family nutrient uptake outer membrane protein [Pontibacter sp. E15-1]|uniref:RagB/SusD family nutrient uptake outer membrane protein n=1 Tax=Pontibacter sp. E15-1 TaxID=2919918 RepID=UPI001F4FBD3E|nr:RagB/SusD family nutrient uptake outer membrane protein [Pontibacter sp. E15-1]MCJ8165935.1 RagB/SusD family nutrient uptake outer membrane protein [Pontibacter sp. E15-1]
MFKSKNTLIKAVLFMAVLVGTSACEKYLDLRPQDGIVRQNFWKTKEQVQSAVVGIYASMLDNDLSEKLFLWGELRADMLMANSGVRYNEQDVINGNIVDTNPIANWRPFYRTINYCNTVLELAPGTLDQDNTFHEDQLHAYMAEALTIRSLMYFYLVRSFGEVPLKLDATISDEQDIALPKNSAEEILEQITKDLEQAEQWAAITYGNTAANKGRVTKYTVNALQADVYLWKSEYEKSIAACDKLINSGQFALVQPKLNSSWFQDLYGVGNSSESIFELQFSEQKNNPYYALLSASVGRRFLVAPRVIEEVYTLDENDPLNVDARLNASVRLSSSEVWKYLGLTQDQRRSFNDSYAHFIFYRYADILLMKAEALALTGQGEEALGIVSKIRERANALPGTERTVGAGDVNGLVDYILEERAREFAFEGKRWYDVLRNARRDDYARMDILRDMVIASAPVDRQQTIMNKIRDVNSHYWPIYQYELLTNKNLEQNPFYK